MNTNKFVVVIAFFVAASLGFAQGMRGTGGGGMAGQPIDGTAISPSSVTVSGNTSTQTLSVGTTSTSTRAHFLTEATVYTPSDFSTAHAVFGRNPVSGAGSGGVWLSYHTTDNEGIVGSLSPVVSWRPLSFASSEWKFRQNGATLIANITSTGAFNSVAAAGNQAFSCTNVGCRLSLGNTARYLLDDGTNLEFVAPVQGTSFEALATSGNSFVGGNSSAVMTISSNTTDAITTATVPAILLKASQSLTSTDALFDVQNSSNTSLLKILQDGRIQASNEFSTASGVRVAANIYANSGSSTFVIYGQKPATSTEPPVRIGNSLQPTVDGARLLSVGYYPSAVWTEVAYFSKDGLLRVNSANAVKPTCNADNRGRMYFLDGAAGVADIAEICGKDAANVYAWKALATF